MKYRMLLGICCMLFMASLVAPTPTPISADTNFSARLVVAVGPDLYLYDDGELNLLAENIVAGWMVQVAMDGSAVFYGQLSDETTTLYRFDLATRAPIELFTTTEELVEWQWSPDESLLALITVNHTEDAPPQLTVHIIATTEAYPPLSHTIAVQNMMWLEDGNLLVNSLDMETGEPTVRLINTTDGSISQLDLTQAEQVTIANGLWGFYKWHDMQAVMANHDLALAVPHPANLPMLAVAPTGSSYLSIHMLSEELEPHQCKDFAVMHQPLTEITLPEPLYQAPSNTLVDMYALKWDGGENFYFVQKIAEECDSSHSKAQLVHGTFDGEIEILNANIDMQNYRPYVLSPDGASLVWIDADGNILSGLSIGENVPFDLHILPDTQRFTAIYGWLPASN